MQRRNRTEWESLIAEQAQSGLAQAAFCEQEGINQGTFKWWKKEIAKSEKPYVELQVPHKSKSKVEVTLPCGTIFSFSY